MAGEESSRPFFLLTVCTRNRDKTLLRFVDSVGKLAIPAGIRVSLLVIDNNDKRRWETSDFDLPAAIDIHVIHEPRPGVAHARNAGFDFAERVTADWVLGADDDGWLDENWLKAYLEAIAEHRGDILLGRIVLHVDPAAHPILRALDLPAPPLDRQPKALATSSYAIAAKMFSTSRGAGLRFDPAFNESGGEDTELMLRASRLHGACIRGVPEAIFHEEKIGRRATLAHQFSRMSKHQLIGYVISDLHRKNGILQTRKRLSVMVAQRTLRSVALAFGYGTMGIAGLLIRWNGSYRMLMMAMQYSAWAYAVVPFVLGRRPKTYGIYALE